VRKDEQVIARPPRRAASACRGEAIAGVTERRTHALVISPAKLGALPAQLSLILDRIDARLAPGATCWMQVPGTAQVVPLIAGTGPVTTWRIGHAGLDTGVTVGQLESALG
jgi:hypothetical protein